MLNGDECGLGVTSLFLMQRALVRSPVGSVFLVEIFSALFPQPEDKCQEIWATGAHSANANLANNIARDNQIGLSCNKIKDNYTEIRKEMSKYQ